jgi:hypothetical protein
MTCAELRAAADSYLAGELPPDAARAAVAHVDGCPACRAELDARQTLRRTLRRAVEGVHDLAPTPDFTARLEAGLLQQASAGSRSAWFNRPVRYLALAAALVVVAVLGWQVIGPIGGTDPERIAALAAHAAGDHRDCALHFALDEPPISLDEAARLYDAAFARLLDVVAGSEPVRTGAAEVLAGHSCVFRGRRFAHIVLRHRDRVVSVLVTSTDGRIVGRSEGPVIRCPPDNGLHLACFDVRTRAVFVVSDLPDSDNFALAQSLAPAIQAYFGVA